MTNGGASEQTHDIKWIIDFKVYQNKSFTIYSYSSEFFIILKYGTEIQSLNRWVDKCMSWFMNDFSNEC